VYPGVLSYKVVMVTIHKENQYSYIPIIITLKPASYFSVY